MAEQPNYDKFKVLNKGTKIERTAYTLNGELHRTDGPAFLSVNGTKEWFQNGKYHRTDGPAIEWPNGTKWWYQNGKKHRLDGPAVVRANGEKEWFIDGQELTEKEFNERTRND